MKIKHQDKRNRRAAFTLTEIMITASLFSTIAIALAVFLVDMTNGMFWTTKKSLISKDIRNFTQRITRETLGANIAYIYPSYELSERDEKEDRRNSGETGDCLVLIHLDPHPNIDDPKHYTRLILYYRQPDEDSEGPVYRVEKTFDTPQPIDGQDYDHFEEFLAKHFNQHLESAEVVLELSRGLADGRLFRDFGNNSFIINGEILHGNKVKEVTNTYNLTVSPRG